MKMFIGIVCSFTGTALIFSTVKDVRLAGGIFLLVFGASSMISYRGTSLNHL
jgi:hypothetical protein